MCDRDTLNRPVVLEHIDDARVSQMRNRRPRESPEGYFIVQGHREYRTHFVKEPLRVFSLPPLGCQLRRSFCNDSLEVSLRLEDFRLCLLPLRDVEKRRTELQRVTIRILCSHGEKLDID